MAFMSLLTEHWQTHEMDLQNRAQFLMKVHCILHRNGLILELIEWIQCKVCSAHILAQDENRIRVG